MSPTMTENPREKRSTEEKLRKERLLDEKMKLIRQKNEERMKRRKEVEEDIRNANSHSEEVCSKSTIQPGHNMSGVKSELGKPVSKFRGRARGRILEKMALEKPQAHRFKERQRKNYELVEKELQEEKSSPGLGKSSGFLSDDQRADMSKITSRSSHSWGGSQFEHVRDKINKDQPRRKQDRNMDINMTGKERVQYHEWKDKRSKIDQDRTSRQMRGNTWQREWDQSKDKKGESSFGGKQDQPDRMQSEQRFGERARRTPDWDHHDDRGAGDSFTDSIPETTRTHNSEREETSGKELSENWDEYENTECRQESVCSDSMETRDVCTNKEEDWEEEIETTPINIYDNIIQFNQEPEQEQEVQEPEDLPQEERTNDTLDITDNFTVTVDPQGKRNVTDKSSETTESLTNKVLNETTLDTNTRENAEHPRETSSISNELEQESDENQVTEDSCKELHINTEDDNNVSSTCGGNREEVAETATEFCTNEQSIIQENSSEAGESKPIQESDTAVTEAPTKDMKPKDNLPKLDLTKAKEEPFPDFLKTPQHKDWAECDFDEDELDLSSDLVFYP